MDGGVVKLMLDSGAEKAQVALWGSLVYSCHTYAPRGGATQNKPKQEGKVMARINFCLETHMLGTAVDTMRKA